MNTASASERQERFYPLGYPVMLSAGNPEVFSIAESSWGGWSESFSGEPIALSVQVMETPPLQAGLEGSQPLPSGRRFSAKPHFSVTPEGFQFHYGASETVFHAPQRRVCLRVSAALLQDPHRFRHHVLDAVILAALDFVFFTPVHAACVSLHGRGVLLCGDSGAGKSTLAYACARAGWALVSDDAVHAPPGPGTVVAGFSQHIHLRHPARSLFPELASQVVIVQPNGKEALKIRTGERGLKTAQTAEVHHVVFLSRRPGPACLNPFPLDDAVCYLLKYLWQPDTAAHERRFRELLGDGACQLAFERIEDGVAALTEVVGRAGAP